MWDRKVLNIPDLQSIDLHHFTKNLQIFNLIFHLIIAMTLKQGVIPFPEGVILI